MLPIHPILHPIHTTTPIGYVGNLTNSAPSTEAIPNACSRNWLRPSPWSNDGLAKIPKAFRPSGRGRSGSGLVGGGWSWQTRKFSTNWGYSNPKPDWSWKETKAAIGLTLFIEKDMPTFYHWCFYRYLFCTLLGWPVRKSVRVEIEDLDKQLSALFLNG